MGLTLVGQWLRAGALERHDDLDRTWASIEQSGSMGEGRNEVVFSTFELAVERWLATASVAEMRPLIDRFLDRYSHAEPPFPFIEVEAVVRAARGEPVAIDAVEPDRRFVMSTLLFWFLCIDREVSQDGIEELIAEAETRASGAGFEIKTPEEIAMSGNGG
jgi:hypothetical protein